MSNESIERRLDDSGSKRRMGMLVMKLMMKDYFRLMVGRNQSDCYIQLWESKTSQSGRPFSPSDAAHRPFLRRGLTRKFVFPPSPETSSEQMRTVSRFSSSAMSVLPGDGGVCDVLRYVRRGISASLDGQEPPAGANRKPANNLRGSSGCRSRAASTRNKAVSAAPVSAISHVVTLVMLPGRARGKGLHARCRALGRSRVGAWRCTKLWARSLCAYKDMRRCPVKHFQDFPRSPKTLGHAARQQDKLHLGTRKPTRCPQPRHRLQIRSCTRARSRRPGLPDIHPE